MSVRILTGDCRDVLATLPAESVHCCVTSPPYWGLRDYGIPPSVWGGDPECEHEWGDHIAVNATNHTTKARWSHTRNGRDELQPVEKRVSWLRTEVKQGQFCQHCGAWAGAFGLEPTYELYVEHSVEVFQAVRRVLRPDATLWLNLGDSYATGAGKVGDRPGGGARGDAWAGTGPRGHRGQHLPNQSGKAAPRIEAMGPMTQPNRMPQAGLKPKDLCGVPWRVALSLQADGWWLRQDIIWSKPNPMPESVTDRCTKAHEYMFLLSKSERYYFDAEAIAEPASQTSGALAWRKIFDPAKQSKEAALKESGFKGGNDGSRDSRFGATRNKRSVWEVATQPFSEAHFATFPPALIEPCILAGCPRCGTVLDPFGGAGTTGLVADRLQRDAILIELNPAYAEMAQRRLMGETPLFSQVDNTKFDKPYDAMDDFAKSLDYGYGLIRDRMAAGGPGWEPKG